MKRQWKLILKLLTYVEQNANGDPLSVPEVGGFSPDEIHYHIRLCIQGGLVERTDAMVMPAGLRYSSIGTLTWAGHDALDRLRKDCTGLP